MIVLLAVFGIVSVIVAWTLARSIRLAVEEASPSPTLAPAGGSPMPVTPSPRHTRSPAASPSAPDMPGGVVVLTAKGAQLRSANGRVSGWDAEQGCTSLIPDHWEGMCNVEEMAGSPTAWIWESQPVEHDSPILLHRVRVLTYSDELNGWVEQLRADDLDEPPWMSVRVVARDLTGDGKPELVVGYHYAGSGQDLGTDIVVNSTGVPRALHLDDAVHGSVVFQGRNLIQYRADPAPADANCCPSAFARTRIQWDGEDFAELPYAKAVPPGQVPASDL